MEFDLILRSRGVQRVLVGVPAGGADVVARIETAGGDVVTLEERTLAALARAYLAVRTHPTLRAVELVAAALPDRKDGYAEVQLVEGATAEQDLRAELADADPADEVDVTRTTARPMVGSAVRAAVRALETEQGGPWTEHGGPADLDDLDLDDAVDEEPLFGELRTEHSRPRSRRDD